MKRVYLDYAAATPLCEEALSAMQKFYVDEFHNPSALYKEAREAKHSLDQAREQVARLIGARPSEVVFTAGGTESDNLAIQGVMNQYPDSKVLISAVEHDAVREPAQAYEFEEVEVDHAGRLNTADLTKKLSDDVVLVSVMLVNNEVGTVQNIEKLVDIVRKARDDRRKRGIAKPLYVHTDACQAPLWLDVHVARQGVDLMTLNGGKIHGPKQSGILYIRAGTQLSPQIVGGGQEMGYRSGTENVAFAAGFAAALERSSTSRHERVTAVSSVRDYFISELEEKFDCEITGDRKKRVANNVHVLFPGTDNERVLFSLDEQGIAAATGSACSASSDEPSHVLRAMGYSDEQARSSIRFSLGEATTREEIDSTIQALKVALKA